MHYRNLAVLALMVAQASYSAVESNSDESSGIGRGSVASMSTVTAISTTSQIAGAKRSLTRPSAKAAVAQISISGTPTRTVLAGGTYAFAPVVTGFFGLARAFSIVNCPSWATFDSVTGRLFGTPSVADIGSYSKIAISVSVGGTVESLPSFAITVTDLAAGSASLTWESPTQKTDGTGLEDMVGFHIRYGMNPSSLDQMVDVLGRAHDSYTVSNLLPGTWYFEVQAFSASSMQGTPSTIVSKTVL